MRYIKTFEWFQERFAICTNIPLALTHRPPKYFQYGEEHRGLYKCRSQTLTDVLDSAKEGNASLRPNTEHSQLPDRLSVSKLSKEYPDTYRPEGLVFETDEEPAFACPVDVMALTNGETFTSSDYFSNLMTHASRFMEGSYKAMIQNYPNPKMALEQLNELRVAYGLKELTKKQIRPYNECCFFKEIPIKPVALIGKSKEMKILAKEYGLPWYKNANAYLKNN